MSERVFSVTIRRQGERYISEAHRMEEFGEDDLGDPTCLGAVIAAALIASLEHSSWVLECLDAIRENVESHIEDFSDRT